MRSFRNLPKSVGSFSSCPVLVAHHLSASGFDPHGRFGSGGRAGAVSDQIAAGPISSIFLVRFFVRSEGRFFVPTCPWPVTPRAGAVKDGRRGSPSPNSALARPRLDGGEHGVKAWPRSEEHTSELQSRQYLVCR